MGKAGDTSSARHRIEMAVERPEIRPGQAESQPCSMRVLHSARSFEEITSFRACMVPISLPLRICDPHCAPSITCMHSSTGRRLYDMSCFLPCMTASARNRD